MTNKLNNDKSGRYVAAALICAFVFTLTALITGMVLGLNKRERVLPSQDRSVSHFLLVDAAAELNGSTSALRLANAPESAKDVLESARMSAVRAETALECEGGECYACREKEAFLNDAIRILASPALAMKNADALHRYSNDFYVSVRDGGDFRYGGELGENSEEATETPKQTEEEKAKKLAEKVFGATAEHIGSYGGTARFSVTAGGAEGYVAVCGDRITEYAFPYLPDGDTDASGGAGDVAVKAAEALGYADLSVYSTEISGGAVKVKLCKTVDGALCRDECACVIVSGGKPVAFSAGKCGAEHKLPVPKVGEEKAREQAPAGSGAGRLVTTFDGERDRICYEYAYELDDGTHYLYVCAESGNQMNIR